MSKLKKWLLTTLGIVLGCACVYLYVWEKPKLERYVKNYVESMSRNEGVPFYLKIERANFSIFPLQVELFATEFKSKKDIKKMVSSFKVDKISVRPSLIDLFIGKFWIQRLKLDGAKISAKLETQSDQPEKEISIQLSKILKRIPLSQIELQNIKLNLEVDNRHALTTENLYLKVYNEKTSIIFTVKDPNTTYRDLSNSQEINFLSEIQVMATDDSLSLSKLKVVKDSSYFLGSGNMLYRGEPLSVREFNFKTRLKSDFSSLNKWINKFYPLKEIEDLKGGIKSDVTFSRGQGSDAISTEAEVQLEQFKVGKILIGDLKANLKVPNKSFMTIDSIDANLAGSNRVTLKDIKIDLIDKKLLSADVTITNAELHSFLLNSTIADIPVWLNVDGNLSCNGSFDKKVEIVCPGAATVSKLTIKNGSRTKQIVGANKIDIAGQMRITEKAISYQAKAQLEEIQADSKGVIDYSRGFDISYSSENLDFSTIGPIADLQFAGQASLKGATKGDSDSAVFNIDIESQNFEFQDYFLGQLKSSLNYLSGTLYFKDIDGNLESTRYNGYLNVNLLKDTIKGDIRLPFFRMDDVQQAILKKVNLEQRFLGSGSANLRLDTSFDIDALNFNLDARLFKGQVFGEIYNEAKIQVQAVEGVMIVQQGLLEKENSRFKLKGTIDTELTSELDFVVENGSLQQSSLIKGLSVPVAGQFNATGRIYGPLASPFIKTSASIENFLFNKKTYGPSIFSYDNSKKQTNVQFNIVDQMEFLVLVPEKQSQNFFIDLNLNNLDIAPVIGFLASEEATRNYQIDVSGELSGNINRSQLWDSEFSSTIKNISLDYKANRVSSTIPTNIELKNNQLFFNQLNLIGKKQFIKITQPFTQPKSTQFIINAKVNIAFFKILAPFIEKIDGYSTLRLELGLNHEKLKLIGSSYISDSFLKFPGFPHAFENLRADILFNQNKVLINSLLADIAGGRATGSGEVSFKSANDFDLSIDTQINDVTIDFPEGFTTRGDATIKLSGNQLPFLLSGKYDVSGGLVESNFSGSGSSSKTDLLEDLLKKEVASPLVLDIDIKTTNSVEIRNSLVEGYVEGDFNIYDKLTSPKIKGTAKFEDDSISTSVVRFSENEFEVISSEFIFDGQTPINPKLSLRSTSRLNGYDINLILQGRALKPQLSLSSQPPLPETQIISMLALGQLPEQFETGGGTSGTTGNETNATPGFEIGTSLLNNNPLGKEIKNRTGLDVQFSSSFDDQNNSAVPKITVRKKFTKKLQVSVSQATGAGSQAEGQVSYELNNRLSTIFRVTNNSNDNNIDNNTTSTRQNNPFGVDLEYKLEFD